ncbi:hypothetical protein ACFXP3_07945 [Streptomyces sp. NPDC059096]
MTARLWAGPPQGDPADCSGGRTVHSSVPNSLGWIRDTMRDF